MINDFNLIRNKVFIDYHKIIIIEWYFYGY